jgi:hypothetical protein
LSRIGNSEIEEAVLDAAWRHLRAGTAEEALGFYLPDAVVAGDGRFQMMDEFARDAHTFYRDLETVETAEWIDPQVRVISDHAAVFSARVRWSSIDSSGQRLDLDGVWTSLWVATVNGWRMASRHESFRHE